MAALFASHDQWNDSSGNPLGGALRYFYLSGTTTDLTTYQDAGATTPHAQPVVADASGTFPAIFVTGSAYKTVVKTSAGVTIQTIDGISPPINLDTEDQSVSGGARIVTKDLGTKSSGTLTPDPGDRPVQKVTNGGAFTLAPGTNYGSYRLDVTNNASAGAVTTSGWTKVVGAFTTTNGNKFMVFCNVSELGSFISIQAMQ